MMMTNELRTFIDNTRKSSDAAFTKARTLAKIARRMETLARPDEWNAKQEAEWAALEREARIVMGLQ